MGVRRVGTWMGSHFISTPRLYPDKLSDLKGTTLQVGSLYIRLYFANSCKVTSEF